MSRVRMQLVVLVAAQVLVAALLVGAPARSATGLGATQVLVDVAWVAAHLERPDVRVVDVSSAPAVYARGHLAGAVYVHWQADLTDPTHRVKGMAPTREQFQVLARRLGIRNEDSVILYDDTSSLFAARAFWIFKLYRHPRIAILDGGSRRWVAEGRPLVTGSSAPAPSTYAAPPRDESILATTEDLLAKLGSGLVCDARSPREYAGLDVRAARGGHIPHAVNVEWTAAVNPDGTFKPAEALAAIYGPRFARDREVIVYCQTGVRAAHTWFVLKSLLGYPRVRNYDGSWEEWGNRSDTPVQR
ncbi:MAG: sulfurtransferase [Armatimonadota bacterium]|nr:sulfurtransferase [Armatimonadota bacterium]MDR7485213.1 sulfurtransferase [Armatimonadota bacterium]MDR7534008.1 sulfurtransferase [Armatimonadota bacterium]MDR7536539.1 sulfurtransferase [Armatimonadota bacterium]